MKNGRRAAKYKRISADREGRELGVDRQDEDLDALAERLGLTVVADYTDNDISASTASRKARPEYNRLLADARAGRFEVILAYTSNRLTRRPREHEDLIDLATGHGITFQYLQSPSFDLNTSAGRMVARILAASDAAEAEDIAERVQRAKLQAASHGKWRGGRRPFGYEADGVTVRPDEAAEVLRCSENLLRGTSIRSMSADLNRRGIRTTFGQEWRPATLRKCLARARNAGFVEHDGQVVGPAVWPAIVPEGLWRAVVAILGGPGRRTMLSNARVHLGSGLYLCGECGARVRIGATGPAPRLGRPSQPTYRCSSTRHLARLARRVDEVVHDVMVARLSRPDAVDLLRPEAPDLAPLHLSAAALRVRLEELATLHADGVLTAAQLVAGTERARQQLGQVEAKLAEAAAGSVFEGLVGFADVERRWRGLGVDRQRMVVARLVTVTLLPLTRQGRPAGWRAGQSYFRPESVRIEPKRI